MQARHVTLTIAALLCTPPALAQAEIDFAEYPGAPIIGTGESGAKITKNGIDYWASGKPPRRYQVIGRIADRRSEESDGGNAVGTPTLAKKVKQAGGSAVIMLEQNDVSAGSSGERQSQGGGAFFLNGCHLDDHNVRGS